MTNKQKKIIKLLEYFSPSWIKDWDKCGNTDSIIGISNIDNGKTSPEECYFNKTDKGISPTECSNISRLRKLLWGHRWMATTKKMWIEAAIEGSLSPVDFDDNEVKQLFIKTIKNPMMDHIEKRFDENN